MKLEMPGSPGTLSLHTAFSAGGRSEAWPQDTAAASRGTGLEAAGKRRRGREHPGRETRASQLRLWWKPLKDSTWSTAADPVRPRGAGVCGPGPAAHGRGIRHGSLPVPSRPVRESSRAHVRSQSAPGSGRFLRAAGAVPPQQLRAHQAPGERRGRAAVRLTRAAAVAASLREERGRQAALGTGRRARAPSLAGRGAPSASAAVRSRASRSSGTPLRGDPHGPGLVSRSRIPARPARSSQCGRGAG